MNTENKTIIFTDGASKGNPGPGGYAAIIVHDGHVFEIGGSEANTTNNRMEMRAVLESLIYAFKKLQIKNKIVIYLDSSYVLKGATQWIDGWKERGWITKDKKDVSNRDLWEQIADQLANPGADIEWKLLSGHVGIAGNERADEIATAFAASVSENKGGKSPELFSGKLADYISKQSIDILNISFDSTKKENKKKSSARSGAKAYSYLSMVKGIIKTHATWAECEARVKGVSGAKFKKATGPEEEKEIVAEWSSRS